MVNSSSSTVSLSSLAGNHGWVVQKFGGTSVGKFPEKIVDDVVSMYINSNKIAVVCSARSSNTKSEGTTSRLILSADLALAGKDYKSVIDLVREDHINNANLKIKDDKIKQQLIKQTNELCNQTETLLHASTVIEEISYKTLDSIISTGERLSCLFVAALMNDRGIPAKFVDLSLVIPPVKSSVIDALDSNSSDVSLDQDFYNNLAASLANAVSKEVTEDGVVPVITGYFGVVPGGLLNNIGRGYTDLCAALVAVGLVAEELQIWKEVDGIFTADPRKVMGARLLPTVTPDEAAELTYYGSEVIHPFTMEQVIKAKIPIRIKNVENPLGKGTIIFPDDIGRKGEATPPHPPVASDSLALHHLFTKKKTPTAVTAKHDIVVINVHSNKKTLSHGFLANIFAILDKYKLVVDLISTSEVHVSMALYNTEDNFNSDLRKAMKELSKMGTIDLVKNLAIVSLVGKQMRQLIGIAGHMFETLAKEKINIEMISQGANEINISCVVNESDSLKALQAIHRDLLDDNSEQNLTNDRLAKLKLENDSKLLWLFFLSLPIFTYVCTFITASSVAVLSLL